MVKKFKNGKLCLSIVEEVKVGYYNDKNIYDFIDDEMYQQNLGIYDIHGYKYIVDFITNKAYRLEFYNLKNFLDKISTKKLQLLPLKTCKDLLEDLTNR